MIRKLLVFVILLAWLSACNLGGAPGTAPAPTTDVQMLVQTAVRQTLAVEPSQATVQAPPAPATELPAFTPSLAFTNTTAPATVVPPPLPTMAAQDFQIDFVAFDRCSEMRFARLRLTNTGTVPWESIEIVLNDQTTLTTSSPLRANEFTDAYTCQETTNQTTLNPGDNAIVYSYGFNHNLAQHQILAGVTLCTQDGQGGQCLSKSIMIFSPPLNQAGFNATYLNISTCPGNDNVLKFQLLNTGNIPWESMRLSVTDLDLNSAVSSDRNTFPDFDTCPATSIANLAIGAAIVTGAAGLPADPTGHNCMAYFKLCSQEDLGGTCLEKTINFKP